MQPLARFREYKSRRPRNRCRLDVEMLEDRVVPSSGPINPLLSSIDDFPAAHTVVLDAGGTATQDGAINFNGDTDTFDFKATASGRITVKMIAQTQDLVSKLTAPGITLFSEHQTASPTLPATTLDDAIQFDVLAGHDYAIQAAGASGSRGF